MAMKVKHVFVSFSVLVLKEDAYHVSIGNFIE